MTWTRNPTTRSLHLANLLPTCLINRQFIKLHKWVLKSAGKCCHRLELNQYSTNSRNCVLQEALLVWEHGKWPRETVWQSCSALNTHSIWSGNLHVVIVTDHLACLLSVIKRKSLTKQHRECSKTIKVGRAACLHNIQVRHSLVVNTFK